MRMKAVLCPVDRSDISARALAYAIAIARRYDARLSVLEVIDWTLPPISGLPFETLAVPEEWRPSVLADLNSFVVPALQAGIPTEICVETGPVVPHILERATDISADLLVLGTHGRGGFERLALGSVAEKVLRKASCPVLTIPPGAGPVADPLFGTVLCAVDFSDSSADGW